MREPLRDLDDDESFDFQAAKEKMALVARAPRRHPKLSLLVFFAVVAIAALAALRVTPVYRAQTDILVQKNVALPTFGESARNAPNQEFDPAMGVSEAVKGRDNLIALVRQTHLVERTADTWDDPEIAGEERVQVLAKALEMVLNVKSDGAIVTFTADWSDPQIAYDLVSAAVNSFLDGRSAAEVSIVSNAITLLEEHAKSEREGIDSAMEEFVKLKETWKGAPSTSSAGAPAIARAHVEGAGVTADLAKRLEEKKLQIKELQDERRRQLSELRGQMAGLLGTYTSSHPAVVSLQRKLDALSEDPANITALKNEERTLLNEIAQGTGKGGGAARSTALAAAVGGGPALTVSSHASALPASKQDLEIADPASAMALSKLQNRIRKYEEFMDQISAAKLQLDLARNAFKFRYGVYKPAEVPTRPKAPVRLLLIVAGLLGGVVTAFGVAAVLDWTSGKFVEPWQVKRKLSLPVLGEVMRP